MTSKESQQEKDVKKKENLRHELKTCVSFVPIFFF